MGGIHKEKGKYKENMEKASSEGSIVKKVSKKGIEGCDHRKKGGVRRGGRILSRPE